MKIRIMGATLFHADRRMNVRTEKHDGSNSRFSHLNVGKTDPNHRMCRTNNQINMHRRFCGATSLASNETEETSK